LNSTWGDLVKAVNLITKNNKTKTTQK